MPGPKNRCPSGRGLGQSHKTGMTSSDEEDNAMRQTKSTIRTISRILMRALCIPAIVIIGVVQLVGTVIVGISTIALKAVSILTVTAALLLFLTGSFGGGDLIVVISSGIVLFWLPELFRLLLAGITAAQAIAIDHLHR